MKFVYVVSAKLRVIDLALIDSERSSILEKLVGVNIKNIIERGARVVNVDIDKSEVQKLLDSLLDVRMQYSDIPDYKGRFTDEEIFIEMFYGENVLKLSRSGFDNNIIFLLNIFNSFSSSERLDYPSLLVFVKNHKEFRNWIDAFK